MITRRTLLVRGIAAAASLSVTSAFSLNALAQHSSSSALPFHKLLFDGRYAAGKLFGSAAANLGMDVHDIDGDVTGIWYRDLRHLWKEADVAIAGLTTFSSYLSLKMMSDNIRIRSLYLGYHHLENSIGHELFGSESLMRLSSLDHSGELWPSEVAKLMKFWSDNPGLNPTNNSTVGLAAERYLGASSLVSWILAPKTRREKR
jgi:hypothetical protein